MRESEHRSPKSDYGPYEAFLEGLVDFRDGSHRNPYAAVPALSAEAQAWDRGQEAGQRIGRARGRM